MYTKKDVRNMLGGLVAIGAIIAAVVIVGAWAVRSLF